MNGGLKTWNVIVNTIESTIRNIHGKYTEIVRHIGKTYAVTPTGWKNVARLKEKLTKER